MIGLVVGSGLDVHCEVEKALQLGQFDKIVGCNLAALSWPGIMDAWASVHMDLLDRPWVEARRRMGLPDHRRLVYGDGRMGGTSGMLALRVALEDLKCDKVVLCGIPLDNRGHFYDKKPWRHAKKYQVHWAEFALTVPGRVRSMSGFTAELFGVPDAEWVNEALLWPNDSQDAEGLPVPEPPEVPAPRKRRRRGHGRVRSPATDS